jgi:hypothetical protein
MARARPQRLPDGRWGALAPAGTREGDALEIHTRGGSVLHKRAGAVRGVVVETDDRPPPVAREVMPCVNIGCAGTWIWAGQDVAPLREDRPPIERMCKSCRERVTPEPMCATVDGDG